LITGKAAAMGWVGFALVAIGRMGSSSERSMISTTYFLLMGLGLISSYKY
jgi:hypothetical protein